MGRFGKSEWKPLDFWVPYFQMNPFLCLFTLVGPLVNGGDEDPWLPATRIAKEGLRGFQQLVGGTLQYLGEGDLCQTPGSTGTCSTGHGRCCGRCCLSWPSSPGLFFGAGVLGLWGLAKPLGVGWTVRPAWTRRNYKNCRLTNLAMLLDVILCSLTFLKNLLGSSQPFNTWIRFQDILKSWIIAFLRSFRTGRNPTCLLPYTGAFQAWPPRNLETLRDEHEAKVQEASSEASMINMTSYGSYVLWKKCNQWYHDTNVISKISDAAMQVLTTFGDGFRVILWLLGAVWRGPCREDGHLGAGCLTCWGVLWAGGKIKGVWFIRFYVDDVDDVWCEAWVVFFVVFARLGTDLWQQFAGFVAPYRPNKKGPGTSPHLIGSMTTLVEKPWWPRTCSSGKGRQ